MPKFLVEFMAQVQVEAADEGDASFAIYDASQWLGAPAVLDVTDVLLDVTDVLSDEEDPEEPEA